MDQEFSVSHTDAQHINHSVTVRDHEEPTGQDIIGNAPQGPAQETKQLMGVRNERGERREEGEEDCGRH